jgi:hypothetical protein
MFSSLLTPNYYKEAIIVPFTLNILLYQPNRRIYVDLYCGSLNCGTVQTDKLLQMFRKTHSLIPKVQILS